MLTTFNKVALDEIKKIRASHQEDFVKKYGVKLGFMSFFTKAACIALNEFPLVNARLEHESIVEHHYCSVGIAVSTERGLVVPVIKNAHKLSLAEIEMQIKDFATKARSNQLNIDDMQGGTFTITNGGVFGSMLSTPILNAPQTAILGMHNIEPTPVVVNDEIVIRQIMYLALSYDHRLVDGKDSVQFLVRIKQLLEDPTKLLIGV
jgi:2-oxoglutarate dehydrogenase E2 component (dihydrolipoamide succinyltransferase)